jgi:hypothetical protein
MQMDTETADITETARREMEDAKNRLSDAATRVKHEAMNAGSTVSGLVMDELDRRAADLGSGLRELAEKMRDATAAQDQNSQAPRLLTPAIDLIDDVSHRLEGQSARQIGDSLSQFGRENPMLFMLGCLATGVLAGRLLVASDSAEAEGWQGHAGQDFRYSDTSGYAGDTGGGASSDFDLYGSSDELGPDDVGGEARSAPDMTPDSFAFREGRND